MSEPQSYVPQSSPPLPAEPKKSSFPTWLLVILVILGGAVVLMATLGVLAIFGVRKYIANAKIAEARNSLGQLGKDAAAAYEASASVPGKGTLCASASTPVPANEKMVSGKKYQSSAGDWEVDAPRKAGFACLKVSMMEPQYFQYNYESGGGKMKASARGDLNGDGVFSRFELQGETLSGVFVVAPALMETHAEE
jgi:type IV pilus assembly protein PilA